MMKIVKKSVSRVAQVWCDIQNYLASKNQLDAHNPDFNCQRLEPRQLLSATPGGSEVPDENNINQTQIVEPLSDEELKEFRKRVKEYKSKDPPRSWDLKKDPPLVHKTCKDFDFVLGALVLSQDSKSQ